MGLYFCNIFLIYGLILLWSRGFTIFQNRIPKWLLWNSNSLKTWKDQKRRQILSVLKLHLEKFDIKPSRLVLSVLTWCKKEVYSLTVIEKYLCLFVQSRMKLKLSNSRIHSNTRIFKNRIFWNNFQINI